MLTNRPEFIAAVHGISKVGAAAVLGGTLLAVSVLLPVPFIELAPGPTFNTLGEADGTPIISIQRATTYPTSGHLDLTTVNERGGPGNGRA